MNNNPEDLSIIRQDEYEYVSIPFSGTVGIETKVLKVDLDKNRVVVMQRFAPGAYAAPHYHHCTAVAYTVSGSWEYDEGRFNTGDVAYESTGKFHTPSSVLGTEMVIVLDSSDGRMLDNYLEDGTVVRVTLDFYAAIFGKSQAEIDALSQEELMKSVIINPEDAIPLHELEAVV